MSDEQTLMQRNDLKPCPFCGQLPFWELGKQNSCQLHGEPYQAVVIRCKDVDCWVKPKVEGGDIFNGGEGQARRKVAERWNRQETLTTLRAENERLREALEWYYEEKYLKSTFSDGGGIFPSGKAISLSDRLHLWSKAKQALGEGSHEEQGGRG